jgi:hypothetical protein
MSEHIDEILLSQLVDGELDSDEANEVLANVLDDPGSRERLKRHLALRRGLSGWRRQRPDRPAVPEPESARHPGSGGPFRRLAPLAAAAVIGAALVCAGFLFAMRAGRDGRQPRPAAAAEVTPEQMAQIARAFELHESVAGPLKWYADDEANIRLASASEAARAARPVAVVLRLAAAGQEKAPPRSYVVVCRNGESATVELPQSPGGGPPLRIHLAPFATDGEVGMQYAIAAGSPGEAFPAVLAGRRRIGLSAEPLGQLPMADDLVDVYASAWVIGDQPIQ